MVGGDNTFNRDIIIIYYLNNPEQSSTERQVVGRKCRVHFYVHIPTGVRDERDATLLCVTSTIHNRTLITGINGYVSPNKR